MVSQLLQHKGVAWIEKMDSTDVPPSVVLKAIQVGVGMEREARGLDEPQDEPTETEVVAEFHLIVDSPNKGFKYLDPRQNGVLYGLDEKDPESHDSGSA